MNVLISLQAFNGNFVSAEPGEQGRLVATSPQPFPFKMQELGGGRVRLRSLPNMARYVEAEGGGGQGLYARLDDPTENCVFTLVQVGGEKHVAFLCPDGKHYLTCEDGGAVTARGTQRGPKETFILERAQPGEGKKVLKGRDANPGSAVGEVLWNDKTHELVVDTTLRLIFRDHFDRPVVRSFFSVYGNMLFRNAVLAGLRDADYKVPYIGIFWSSHFYDPDTGKNYMGYGATARSNGEYYFNVALPVGKRIYAAIREGRRPSDNDLYYCGYYLGVAAHYITDLTQPMHSANFANYFADAFPRLDLKDNRHSGLEGMTEDIVVKQRYLNNPPRMEYSQFAPETYASAGDILHEAAVIAKRTFVGVVRPLLPPVGGNWKEDDVKRIIDSSIKSIGMHSVARFFCFWSMHAMRPATAEQEAPLSVWADEPVVETGTVADGRIVNFNFKIQL